MDKIEETNRSSITITVPFDDIDAKNKLMLMLNAEKYASCLWDISQKCRGHRKHDTNCTEHMDSVLNSIQEIAFDTGYEEFFV